MHVKDNAENRMVLYTEESVRTLSADGPVFLEADPLFIENGMSFQEVVKALSLSGPQPCSDRVQALLAYYESYYMSGWQYHAYWDNLHSENSMAFRRVFTDAVREFHLIPTELRKLSKRGSEAGIQLPFTDSDGERVEGELSLGFGLSKSNNLFDAHRIVRPTQYHQGLFPVVVNQKVIPPRIYKEKYHCKEYLTAGDIECREVSGLPEILGPDGYTGFAKTLKPGFLDISPETIGDLEKRGQLDKELEPLNEAKTKLRVTSRALAEHSGNRVVAQWWTPIEGLQRLVVPVESMMDSIPYPKDSDYLASLERMSKHRDGLDRLIQLKKDGDKHLAVIETCKAQIEALENNLHPAPDPDEQLEFDKAVAKINKRRRYWKGRMVRDLTKLQEELGVDLRYFKRDGEEDNDLPVVKAIKDHEYYKSRGQAAGYFTGVHKVKKRIFATSASSRPMLSLRSGSTSEVLHYSSEREEVSETRVFESVAFTRESRKFEFGTLSSPDVEATVIPGGTVLVSRFPWKYNSVVFKDEKKGSLKPVKISKILTCSTSDDFFFMKKHIPTEASFKEGGRDTWTEIELDQGKQALHKELMSFLDLHKDVVSYIFGGVDPDRKEPHGPTEKVEEAIRILTEFAPKTGYAREDRKERLRDFRSILEAMRFGQKLRTDMHLARNERDALKEEYAELTEEQAAFYEEVWPSIPDEEKKVYFGVMAPYDDRSTTKDWVKTEEIYDYRDEPLDLELVEESPVTVSGEFVERPAPREPEGTAKTRYESESEADASEYLLRFHTEVYHARLSYYTEKRYNSIESYCVRWQKDGKEEGFPNNKVQNPWASYGDLFKDLFGRVYGEYFGGRPLGETGEVKEVVFSDGSIAIDSRDQTHSGFGAFLGGTMVRFLQHRQLQDVFFDKIWEDLTFQVWGPNNHKERAKDHARSKERYTEEEYYDRF